MIDLAPLTLAATAVTLALGLVVARLGYRAYRRTDRAALRALSAAFTLIVAGAATGATDQLLGVDSAVAGFAASALTASGFVVLAHSLYRADGLGEGRGRSPNR
jgi:hypothetical protein